MARRHPEDIEGLESATEGEGKVFRFLGLTTSAVVLAARAEELPERLPTSRIIRK